MKINQSIGLSVKCLFCSMKALQAIKWMLSRWWLLLLCFILANVMGYMDMVDPDPMIGAIGFYGYIVFLLLLISSAIYLLVQRRWFAAIFTGLATSAILVLGIAVAFIYNWTSDTDHFNDHLTIPAGIKLSMPIELEQRQQIRDSSITASPSTGFILYNDFQPGLYQYDFWTQESIIGDVFLKVYEVTQNTALSADELPNSSLTLLHRARSGVSSSTERNFTIYEGDWGKPYAARFEVWLKPPAGGQDRKLYEKIFQIEGWQR